MRAYQDLFPRFNIALGILAVCTLLAGPSWAGDDLEKDIPTSVRQFKIKIHVLEKDELGKITTLANPVLITTDDVPATLTIGNQLPVPGTHQLETVPIGIIGRFKVKWLGEEKIRLDVAFETRKAIKADLQDLMVSARSIRAVTEAEVAKSRRYVVSKMESGEPNLWIDVQVDSILVDRPDHHAHAQEMQIKAIKTKPTRPANLTTCVYAVPDLVVTQESRKAKVRHFSSLVSFGGTTSFKQLTEAICSKIAPQTWESAGGHGRIIPHEATTSLVVMQTPEVQDQVAAYLEQLRQR